MICCFVGFICFSHCTVFPHDFNEQTAYKPLLQSEAGSQMSVCNACASSQGKLVGQQVPHSGSECEGGLYRYKSGTRSKTSTAQCLQKFAKQMSSPASKTYNDSWD